MRYHCVIFPVSALRCAMKAVQDCFDTIKAHGSVQPLLDAERLYTRQQTYETLRYKPGQEWTFPSPSIQL